MKTRSAIATCLLVTLAQLAPADAPRTAVPSAQDPHAGHQVVEPAQPIAGESLYQLDTVLGLPDGSSLPLRNLRGKPVLVTMFYTSCDGVCPLLAFTMRRIAAELPEARQKDLTLLLVSFDPGRDTPEALRRFAAVNRLQPPLALVARAAEDDVRELAAVLGIRYRELPEGVFSHSAVITLLDQEGVIRAQTTTLQQLDPDFMSAVVAVSR